MFVRTWRFSLVSALTIGLVSCADQSLTRPSTPRPPDGVPVGLTLNVSPTEVPYLGANVTLRAVVAVQEGTESARVPVRITLALDGATPTTNDYRTDATGAIRELFYLARAADFTVEAGAFTERAHVSRASAPPYPEPTPPPPPPPTPPSPPPVPPAPLVSVTLAAEPQTAVLIGGQATIRFTATAISLNGAGAIVGFEWDFDGDGKFDPGEVTSTGARSHTYATAGIISVGVRASTAGGVEGRARVTVAIASALRP